MAKLVFGCGYLGCRVAERWRQQGTEVHVVTRFSDRARELEQQGFRPIVADVTRPATLVNLPAAETVLYAIGYDRTAGVSIHEVYVNGLHAALHALSLDTGKFIYISSTGVYSQSDGDWVDESSPCHPQREGGRACLAAEEVLATHLLGRHAVVLRLAGLYGPGRIPRLDELRSGVPIPVPADGWLNLIHVDDAVATVLAAEERAEPPRTFLVSDGHPVERREYFQHLAQLIGAPPPQLEVPPPDSPAAQRAASTKRVSNARMLAELGVQLQYPSYRQGLAAIVREQSE